MKSKYWTVILLLGIGSEIKASSLKEVDIDLEEGFIYLQEKSLPIPNSSNKKEDSLFIKPHPYVSETLTQRHKDEERNQIDGIDKKRGEGLPYKEDEPISKPQNFSLPYSKTDKEKFSSK